MGLRCEAHQPRTANQTSQALEGLPRTQRLCRDYACESLYVQNVRMLLLLLVTCPKTKRNCRYSACDSARCVRANDAATGLIAQHSTCRAASSCIALGGW
jgi:hypothetical protein